MPGLCKDLYRRAYRGQENSKGTPVLSNERDEAEFNGARPCRCSTPAKMWVGSVWFHFIAVANPHAALRGQRAPLPAAGCLPKPTCRQLRPRHRRLRSCWGRGSRHRPCRSFPIQGLRRLGSTFLSEAPCKAKDVICYDRRLSITTFQKPKVVTHEQCPSPSCTNKLALFLPNSRLIFLAAANGVTGSAVLPTNRTGKEVVTFRASRS